MTGSGEQPPAQSPPPGGPGYQPPGFGTPGYQPPPYAASNPPPSTPSAYPAQGQPPAPLPPLEYHEILRGGRRGVWRPIVGMLVFAVTMYLLAPTIFLIPFAAWFVADGRDLSASIEQLVDTTDPSPATLAFLLLSLASAIPIAWFVIRVFHGLRPRWLSSVVPGLRWTFMLVCFGLSFATLFVSILLAAVLPGQSAGGEVAGEPNEWSRTLRDFVLVIVLLTPLQAAGEEYAFRGYLTQAFGGLFRNRVAAVVGPALLFALAHGLGQSVPIFVDRLAFGLVAGVLVLVTGGLEAGIAMHVLNNWVAFGLAVAFFDLGDALNPTGGSWWDIPVTVIRSLIYLGLAWWIARLMGLATKTDPAVLEASRSRV